jgi:hypothetical protein
VTTFHHKIHLTGDAEQYARRRELLAWQHYLRMSRSLADKPLTAGDLSRSRSSVQAAKAEFAQAWRALDEVIQ